MDNATKYWLGSCIAGAVLAILFGVLAGNSSGGNQTAYIAAAITCGGIAVLSLVVLIVRAARK